MRRWWISSAFARLAAGAVVLCAAAPLAAQAPPPEATPPPPAPPPPATVKVSPTQAANPPGASTDDEDPSTRLPWHGTTLTLDQSATTQTLRVGEDYQSNNPTYELWLALRPRYYLLETKTDAVSLNLWANLYLELTNSDTTTREREPLLGPTYAWATYARTLRDSADAKTTVTIGPRFLIPTDKAGRGSGQYIGVGGVVGAAQTLPLRGKGAAVFRGGRLGVNAFYNHTFTDATTPTNPNIKQARQDVGGLRLIDDQTTGRMNVRHGVNLAFTGQVELARRLSLSLSYVLLLAWAYTPPDTCIVIKTGCTTPLAVEDPTNFRVNTWATASVEYDVVDDLSIGAGYYNLAQQNGPDGQHRNPLWSPGARFFLSLTGNLDVLYRRVSGRGPRHD